MTDTNVPNVKVVVGNGDEDDGDPAERSVSSKTLTDLPEELLLYLATFLNGRDVVHLSHVNQVRSLHIVITTLTPIPKVYMEKTMISQKMHINHIENRQKIISETDSGIFYHRVIFTCTASVVNLTHKHTLAYNASVCKFRSLRLVGICIWLIFIDRA
jgi:hypothetical protein